MAPEILALKRRVYRDGCVPVPNVPGLGTANNWDLANSHRVMW